jgi:hypothetical protein
MWRGVVAGVGLTLLIAGCGSQKNYANDPRPPSPIAITAAVFPHRISASPVRFGAGPITLTIANLSSKSLSVTLNSAGNNDAPARSGPINPQGTAVISVNVKPGSYTLKSSGSASTTLKVGAKRPSAQDQVLLP